MTILTITKPNIKHQVINRMVQIKVFEILPNGKFWKIVLKAQNGDFLFELICQIAAGRESFENWKHPPAHAGS